HRSVTKRLSFLLGLQFGILKSLNAERAFFHYPPAPYSHIRVKHHAGQIIIDIIPAAVFIEVVVKTTGSVPVHPIETTHLIRAVVCAVFSPDAAIISHLIQTLAAMVSSRYRANVLTGGVVAVLTKHRLENRLNAVGILGLSTEIAVNPQPVHYLKFEHVGLADHADIVLRLTADHAGPA